MAWLRSPEIIFSFNIPLIFTYIILYPIFTDYFLLIYLSFLSRFGKRTFKNFLTNAICSFVRVLGELQSEKKHSPQPNKITLLSDTHCKSRVLARKTRRIHYKLIVTYYREWVQIKISQKKKHKVESGQALNAELWSSSLCGVRRYHFLSTNMQQYTKVSVLPTEAAQLIIYLL